MGERQNRLVRRFRAGDEAAFRALLEQHFDDLTARVHRNLPRHLSRRVSASDVFQESCLAAYRSREDFEDRGTNAFRNWLLGIVDNKIKEAIRHHAGTQRRTVGREVSSPGHSPTAGLLADAASPSEDAIHSEAVRLAGQALDGLAPHYREVIRLRRDEQLSLQAAADRLGRSPGAVKKLYGRALLQLKRAFDRLSIDT